MYNLIYSTYKNSLLEGFSDVELELFEYIINSTPEVMLAYKDEYNDLKPNHGYIVLLVLLTKTLGPSRELILNTAHAKDLQRLYELADTITNLTGFTWVGNNSLTTDDFNYSINFTSNSTSYTTFKTEMSSAYDLYYNNQGVYLSTEDGTDWVHSDYKTIQITGGSDVTNSTLISWLEENGTLIGPSFKLLQLLAGDIWPDILELFTSEEEARSVLYGKIDLVEAMVPIIRKRGTLDSLMTIVNSYIPYNGLAASENENEPMRAHMQLNHENDLYGNRQLYKLLLHAKPAGYKIEVSSNGYPFYETASPALITDSTDPVMPWISNISNGIYPYFGSPLQTPDITDIRVVEGGIDPQIRLVTFKNKHFEPLNATISAEGTYQIGSETYEVSLTPVVQTIPDREPSLMPQYVDGIIYNSFPINITITEVTVTIEPYNSDIPGDNRSASATIDTSSHGIILAPSPIPIVEPTISNINLDENLFTASIDITNNDLVALSGTLAVDGSNSYKVAFTNLMPGETRTLTITHPDLYLREALVLEATRNNDVGPTLTHDIDVAPYVPVDPASLPRLDTPTPVISTSLITEAYGDFDGVFQIIAENTDPVFPVECYGTLRLILTDGTIPTDAYDVTIPAGGTSVLYSIPYYGDPSGATVEFDLTTECAVYTGIPAESIKNPITHTYTTDFSTQPDLPPDPE